MDFFHAHRTGTRTRLENDRDFKARLIRGALVESFQNLVIYDLELLALFRGMAQVF